MTSEQNKSKRYPQFTEPPEAETHERYDAVPIVPCVQWTARVLGLLYIAFFLVMINAHVLQGGGFSVDEFAVLVFLAAVFTGYVVSWRADLFGGMISLAVVAFLFVAFSSQIPIGMLVTLAIPSMLHLVAHVLSKVPANKNAGTQT